MKTKCFFDKTKWRHRIFLENIMRERFQKMSKIRKNLIKIGMISYI